MARESNGSMQEWMGRTVAVECIYQEIDRQLKEQFMHGLNDEEMPAEIIRKLTKMMRI